MTPENQQRIDQATAELKEAFSDKVQVKFKKLHPDARTPIRATDGSAGWDLTMCDYSPCGDGVINYHTGIAVEIPKGFVGILCARSSCSKYRHILANGIGIIDSDYRGELIFKFYILRTAENEAICYKRGDRIGQLVIVPCPAVELVEVEELSETERGTGGFGSTGK